MRARYDPISYLLRILLYIMMGDGLCNALTHSLTSSCSIFGMAPRHVGDNG